MAHLVLEELGRALGAPGVPLIGHRVAAPYGGGVVSVPHGVTDGATGRVANGEVDAHVTDDQAAHAMLASYIEQSCECFRFRQ